MMKHLLSRLQQDCLAVIFALDEIPLNTGVDIVKQAIKIAMGDKVIIEDLTQTKNAVVSAKVFVPATWEGRKISVVDWIKPRPTSQG